MNLEVSCVKQPVHFKEYLKYKWPHITPDKSKNKPNVMISSFYSSLKHITNKYSDFVIY